MNEPSLAAPALEPGARVRVVAPAGPVDPLRLQLGIATLEREYGVDVVPAANLDARSGYFAGDDATRLRELQAALADKDAAAVW